MLLKIIKMCFLLSKGGNFVINSLIKGLKNEDLFQSLSRECMAMGNKP